MYFRNVLIIFLLPFLLFIGCKKDNQITNQQLIQGTWDATTLVVENYYRNAKTGATTVRYSNEFVIFKGAQIVEFSSGFGFHEYKMSSDGQTLTMGATLAVGIKHKIRTLTASTLVFSREFIYNENYTDIYIYSYNKR